MSDEPTTDGKCWSCGECVPWICRCGNVNCSWFGEECEDWMCRLPKEKGMVGRDTRRALADIADLRQRLEDAEARVKG